MSLEIDEPAWKKEYYISDALQLIRQKISQLQYENKKLSFSEKLNLDEMTKLIKELQDEG